MQTLFINGRQRRIVCSVFAAELYRLATMKRMPSPGKLRPPLHWYALTAAVAAPVLYGVGANAQCSGDSDTSLFDCQAPLTATQPTGESPAVYSMDTPDQTGTPAADRSTAASANGSLSSGPVANDDRHTRTTHRSQRPIPEQALGWSEFQRFVFASTGRRLEIYGSNLFERPASFAPVDHAAAPADLRLGADDELEVRIWGQVNYSANLRVSRTGEIFLPKVGPVRVAGLSLLEATAQLRAAMERVYRNFEISVDLGEIHSIQIYVAGNAAQPGQYTVSALSTLIDALFESGGPSNAGSMRHVELKRGGTRVADVDLYDLIARGDKSHDTALQSGDVLYIPAKGPEVALLGSVRQPAIYELRGSETAGELIAIAGGLTATASAARISLERVHDHTSRVALDLSSSSSALATTLDDGDILRVDPIASHFDQSVTLRGAVVSPGHFRWHAGMRLSEVLPDRDALELRLYWWQRTRMGLPSPEFVPDPEETRTQGSAGGGNSETVRPAVESADHATDWNYAVIERIDPATMTARLIPFDLGRLVLQNDASQDLTLEAGDTITVFSQNDIRIPAAQRATYVRLDGEIVHPGIYSVQPGETLRRLIERAGGLTAEAYLYGSELTRLSTAEVEQKRLDEYADRLEREWARNSAAVSLPTAATAADSEQAQLMRTGNHSFIEYLRAQKATGRIIIPLKPGSTGAQALPEIALEDGDHLTVPTRPATMQVIGAVANQGAFLIHPHGSARSYLRLAGGLTRDADHRQAFILRADGSVERGAHGDSLFAEDGFDKLPINPGDTIVIPEKKLGFSPLRTSLAWAQMASQLALGAAAVNVIR